MSDASCSCDDDDASSVSEAEAEAECALEKLGLVDGAPFVDMDARPSKRARATLVSAVDELERAHAEAEASGALAPTTRWDPATHTAQPVLDPAAQDAIRRVLPSILQREGFVVDLEAERVFVPIEGEEPGVCASEDFLAGHTSNVDRVAKTLAVNISDAIRQGAEALPGARRGLPWKRVPDVLAARLPAMMPYALRALEFACKTRAEQTAVASTDPFRHPRLAEWLEEGGLQLAYDPRRQCFGKRVLLPSGKREWCLEVKIEH